MLLLDVCIVKYGIWNVNEPETGAVNALVGSGYSPLSSMVLASRGLKTPPQAAAYLDCNATLPDPFLMTDMDKAAGRVGLAMARGEKIAVFGDYDVDGITSTCLLTDFLRRHGADCVSYIPGRLEEGYGLNPIALHALAQQGIDLVGDTLGKVLGNTVDVVKGFISSIWNLIISVIFSLYCLGNKEQLSRQGRRILYSILPERWADEIIRIGRLSNSTFSNFISGQCIEVLILGTMFAVVMSILRLPYVPLVSVLVALTAFVPIVGAWIGCALGAFFILVNDPMQAVVFVVMFLILQQLENNL